MKRKTSEPEIYAHQLELYKIEGQGDIQLNFIVEGKWRADIFDLNEYWVYEKEISSKLLIRIINIKGNTLGIVTSVTDELNTPLFPGQISLWKRNSVQFKLHGSDRADPV